MTETNEKYYCYNCNSEPLYLCEVSDESSPDFEKICCPYCCSTSVTKIALAVCPRCEGGGCNFCDFDGIYDPLDKEPDGTN